MLAERSEEWPLISQRLGQVAPVVRQEEELFLRTMSRGLELLAAELQQVEQTGTSRVGVRTPAKRTTPARSSFTRSESMTRTTTSVDACAGSIGVAPRSAASGRASRGSAQSCRSGEPMRPNPVRRA